MPQPNDVPALERLLVITKFLSQCIPNKSTITAPLQLLVKKGVSWKWTGDQDQALAKFKAMAINLPILAFYNVAKPVTNNLTRPNVNLEHV